MHSGYDVGLALAQHCWVGRLGMGLKDAKNYIVSTMLINLLRNSWNFIDIQIYQNNQQSKIIDITITHQKSKKKFEYLESEQESLWVFV